MQIDFSARYLRLVLLLAIAYVLGGCSTSNIRSDYDPDVDFGAYETYNFIDGAGPDYEGYESLFTKYMVETISIEMEKRGYVKSDDPDLLVNFNAIVQQKTQVRQTSTPPPSYYGYRRGYYDPWMGYGTQTQVTQYDEGTFNIDLVDAREKKLVWEAIGVGRVTQKALENLEQSVNEGVPEFFAQYPFVAGQSEPVVPDK